eukprot:1489783-Rhodomonas_salina.1
MEGTGLWYGGYWPSRPSAWYRVQYWPSVSSATGLRACYAVPGTELAYGATEPTSVQIVGALARAEREAKGEGEKEKEKKKKADTEEEDT